MGRPTESPQIAAGTSALNIRHIILRVPPGRQRLRRSPKTIVAFRSAKDDTSGKLFSACSLLTECRPETCCAALISTSGPTAAKKPPSSHRFSDTLRHLSQKRGKNSGETGEKSIKNGEKWRFSEGQSAISTSLYTTEKVAETTGMPGLTSASPLALSDLLTANSKTERHCFGCDWDRRLPDRRDIRVAPGSSSPHWFRFARRDTPYAVLSHRRHRTILVSHRSAMESPFAKRKAAFREVILGHVLSHHRAVFPRRSRG
jgi:hypothetical protein